MIKLLFELYLWARSKKRKKNVPTKGYLAHKQGFGLEDNPYRQNSAEHSIWRDDWLFEAGRFR
jgi:hypothetical protein